jgi:hypothetical protein
MFLKNSRYSGLPVVEARGPGAPPGARVVKLRPLPNTRGTPTVVRAHDQLDAMSEALYGGDATRHWHIADAGSSIESAELVRESGRVIDVPPA